MTNFKFAPNQKVKVLPVEAEGRIQRCILDSGPLHIYYINYYVEGRPYWHEFYEDELEALLPQQRNYIGHP